MAIQFPSSPTVNDTYTYNNITWTYNGKGWVKVAAKPAASKAAAAGYSIVFGG